MLRGAPYRPRVPCVAPAPAAPRTRSARRTCRARCARRTAATSVRYIVIYPSEILAPVVPDFMTAMDIFDGLHREARRSLLVMGEHRASASRRAGRWSTSPAMTSTGWPRWSRWSLWARSRPSSGRRSSTARARAGAPVAGQTRPQLLLHGRARTVLASPGRGPRSRPANPRTPCAQVREREREEQRYSQTLAAHARRCVCVCMYLCMTQTLADHSLSLSLSLVCVCERERARERSRGTHTPSQRMRAGVCVCVCVCVCGAAMTRHCR